MSRVQQIIQRLHCLGCGRRFQRRDVQLVGVGHEELDLYLHCAACGLYLQVTLPDQEAAVITSAVVALPRQTLEQEAIPRVAPVSVEDVAEIQQFLATFHGDVSRLLGTGGDSA